ncbi:hypothetical protein K435DRAFT_184981 [Dendrothele bispora CBS 962.96]|uniref:Uncharacterized protein n=1 Tax=Dendrothele bispora (strain CBS 962.96) TaxID=1314807 RepID=A0A4S8LVZ0_DENBC|nr:hypothetical protein K435DRAFT_184981 [Dendrothele bispora CBS 962.96]
MANLKHSSNPSEGHQTGSTTPVVLISGITTIIPLLDYRPQVTMTRPLEKTHCFLLTL